jgi:L-serine dehydratase
MSSRCNSSLDDIIDALACAGIFGNIVKRNGSISGAEAGCQAEIGTATAMAAVAACSLRGLSFDVMECAAEIAIEHSLGLTCDPVEGYVQIPCIERNGISAIKATSACYIAEFVSDSQHISFDQIVKTALETGKDLKMAYRETAQGGLALSYKDKK